MEYNGILIVCSKVAIFIYKKKRGMNPLYKNNYIKKLNKMKIVLYIITKIYNKKFECIVGNI